MVLYFGQWRSFFGGGTVAKLKPIPGFPNYSVTENGGVWSRKRPRTKGGWLKLWSSQDGHLAVFLFRDGKSHRQRVHRLVLGAFVGSCPEGMECRHLDGDATNNDFKNLRWGTKSENAQDAMKHGTHYFTGKQGEDHPRSKLPNQKRRLIHSVYRGGGCSQQELADRFGVHQKTIFKIVNNKRWK